MGKYCHPHLDKGYRGIDEWSELHKDQWQEQNHKSCDVLFYILAKAVSRIILQVSYSCMRERVSLLNYWAHLVVGSFWWGFAFFFFFHFMKPSLDPVCLTARSWQESWQKCAEESQQLYFYVQFRWGQKGMSLSLLFLAVCSDWGTGAASSIVLTEGRWWIEFFQ